MAIYDADKLVEMVNGLKMGPALTDPDLQSLVQVYKKNVASRYKLMLEGDIHYLQDENLYASLKLDGQLHYLYKDKDTLCLLNPRGRVIEGLPLLTMAKDSLADFEQILIVGELYNQDNPRSRVYDVTSALAADGGDKINSLGFAAFDVLQLAGESQMTNSFLESQTILENLPTDGLFHLIEQKKISKEELGKMYNQRVIDEGHEGIVCRSADTPVIYKIKPRHNIDVVIVGFTERPGEQSVRSLLTALVRQDGSFQIFSKIGTGIDEDLRRDLYRKLKPTEVASAYKETDKNHTLFTMVKPEVIVEMAFHDIIVEKSSGKAISKAVLSFDDENGYDVLQSERFLAVLAPVFKRFREDKEVNASDLRLTQLAEFVELDNLDAPSRIQNLAKSDVLQREVYTKAAKKLTNVRKLISWKTNKDETDELFPAFAFCYVDYSPGRKMPLKRVLRTANTADEIDEIFNEFKENEIKKGWALVE